MINIKLRIKPKKIIFLIKLPFLYQKNGKMRVFRIAALSLFFFISASHIVQSGDTKFVIVEENNKKGLLDDKGNLVIPAMYDDLGWSKGSASAVNNVIGFKKGHLWGLISVKNQKIVEPAFAGLYPAGDAFIASKLSPHSNEVLYGLVGKTGKTLISFKYYTLEFEGNDFVASLKRDFILYGLIDGNEKTLLPFRYKNVQLLSGDMYCAVDQDNRKAYFDLSKNLLSPFIYDSIYFHNDRCMIVVKGGKQGLINPDGLTLVEPQYKKITFNDDQTINVLPFDLWSIVNQKNEILASFHFDRVTAVGENILQVTAGKNESLIDSQGNYLTPSGNYRIVDFKNNIAVVQRNGKFGVIPKSGAAILPLTYDSLKFAGNFLLAATLHQRAYSWAVMDTKGNIVSGPEYHEIRPINDSLFAVRINQYWGLIDAKGKTIANCKFDDLQPLPGGVIQAHYINQSGALNQEGQWVITPKREPFLYLSPESYAAAEDFCKSAVYHRGSLAYCTTNDLIKREHDLLEIRNDGKTGLLDLQGSILLNPGYDYISPLQGDSIYVFGKEKVFGIMTKSGRILAQDLPLEEIFPLSEEFLGVKMEGRYGFIDLNGKLRIANRYDSIGKYSESYTAIKLIGKWGYIDKQERLKVQPRYDEAYAFMNGVAVVKKDGKYGLVNKNGQEILKTSFDSLQVLDNGRYISQKEGKFGLIGRDGRELVFPKYEGINDLKNGHVIIQRKGKYGMATADGELIIPIVYDELNYDPHNKIYLGAERAGWEHISLPGS